MVKLIFRVLPALLFLIGCSSIPEYIGTKSSNNAVLVGRILPNIFSALANNSATTVLIKGKVANKFYLEPGVHVVEVRSTSLSLFSPLGARTQLSIAVEGGRKYKITSTPSITTGTVSFFLFDITNKEEKLLTKTVVRGYLR